MHTLLAISLVLASLSLMLTLLTHVCVRRILRSRAGSGSVRPISVLKPLKGLDDELYANLRSLVSQDYPAFELVLGCEDWSDPALPMARQLQRDFPQVSIVVVAGTAAAGLNPKVKTLRLLSQHAQHDWVLVSDSNVRAAPGYLAAMAAELDDPRVGLVTSLLVGAGEQSLGARLDNLHMNSFIVRAVCGASAIADYPCVIGKSMLFSSSTFAKLGGFALVDDVLAEDYVIGRCFAEAGYRVALSPYAIQSVSVERSFTDFFARHLRWGQMRRRLMPMLYIAEPLQTPVPWLLAALLLIVGGVAPGTAPWLVPGLLLGLALRLGSDAAITRALRGTALGPKDYAAILLKDLVFLGIWVLAGLKRSVCWRGTVFRIGAGSRLYPRNEPERARGALESA